MRSKPLSIIAADDLVTCAICAQGEQPA